MKNDRNVGYENSSIIVQLEKYTRVKCALKCGRVEGCGHIAFNEVVKRCNLLRDLIKPANGIDQDQYTGKDDIYSIFKTSSE